MRIVLDTNVLIAALIARGACHELIEYCIAKRNDDGIRTHHVHMIESDFEHWDRLLFRDYLIEHPDTAREYEALKIALAREYPNDREAYTNGKTEFVVRVTEIAKEYYRSNGRLEYKL